jgi:hypothetical protein
MATNACMKLKPPFPLAHSYLSDSSYLYPTLDPNKSKDDD